MPHPRWCTGATRPWAPWHSPRSTAKPSRHSAAMLGRQRASKTAWGPPGASGDVTWGATSAARVAPLSPHSPWGHTTRGCGAVQSVGLSSRASKAWAPAPGKWSHSAPTTLGTRHPAHPPHPRAPSTQAAPRCGGGPRALTVCGGALPAAEWMDCQGLPGDTGHRWGIFHRHPAEGQLPARRRQHGHHLGMGSGWHRVTPAPGQPAPASV